MFLGNPWEVARYWVSLGRKSAPEERSLSNNRSRFRISLPNDDTVFNRTSSRDLFTIDATEILQIIEKENKRNAAGFLSNKTADEVWRTYLSIFPNWCFDNPLDLHEDESPQFQALHFKNYWRLAGIKLKLAGNQSHNSHGGAGTVLRLPEKDLPKSKIRTICDE